MVPPMSSAKLVQAGPLSDPAPFTADWTGHHLPLIDAAIDLLGADDADFARRTAAMADGAGRALLEELAAEFETTRGLVAAVVDALDMAAQRVRAAIAA